MVVKAYTADHKMEIYKKQLVADFSILTFLLSELGVVWGDNYIVRKF
ncbi:MAG: hypothetical protein ACXITR_10255 [Cyanobacterium sp.]